MLSTLSRLLNHEMRVSEFLGTLISFLGSIVCWPVLTFSNVCMT